MVSSQERSERLCSIFKALADPIRLRLFALLAKEELCVCHLTEALKLPQSTVSRHLGVFRAAALVETRREGKWMYYRLAEDVPEPLVAMVAPVADGAGGINSTTCSPLE